MHVDRRQIDVVVEGEEDDDVRWEVERGAAPWRKITDQPGPAQRWRC